MQIEYLGNRKLLESRKVAFLCSRTVSSGAIMRCYDWATQMADSNNVVIGGFQSKIEKDVLHFLLKGRQPVIIVIARQMYKELHNELTNPMNEGRLLIVSTAPNAVRVSKDTANKRNSYISEIADEIVFGYISKDSSLNELFQWYKDKSRLLNK
jgi:predicted Rossmann fold nucleotide-binding protein DprA/Smf involved in DNA uptake